MLWKVNILFRIILFCAVLVPNIYGFREAVIQKHESRMITSDVDADIRNGFEKMNEMLATKDLQKVMNIFDDAEDIMVIGSDSGEVYIGKNRVQSFLKIIVSMPFVFSFEMDSLSINHSKNIAWFFGDGKMVHTRPNGKVSKVPYRITAVMVQKGNDWKWKVFSGSIPRGE
jgi:ketosteroid isomerase-like protein